MTVSAELRKSLENLELFTELVRSQVDRPEVEFERLLEGYLEARRALSKQFCLVAQRYLLRGDSLLETTRKRIEERMAEVFGGRVPEKYLVVHGYKSSNLFFCSTWRSMLETQCGLRNFGFLPQIRLTLNAVSETCAIWDFRWNGKRSPMTTSMS